jgi:hypothetical protein
MSGGGDGPEKGRGGKLELSCRLKAVEADLALLRPREDRLDRQRLIFLAGQASVSEAGHRQRTSFQRWAWPASFGAMTAVAGSLLVLLLVRPEPQVIERLVYVPSPSTPAKSATTASDVERGSTPGYEARSQTVAADYTPHSLPLAASRPSPPGSLPAGGIKFRLFDHLLAEQPYLQMPAEASSGGDADRVNRQILSPRRLNELLEESATGGFPADRPRWRTTQNPGASS